jgi:hypothetical protein
MADAAVQHASHDIVRIFIRAASNGPRLVKAATVWVRGSATSAYRIALAA